MAEVKQVVDEKNIFSRGTMISLEVRMWGATAKLDEDKLGELPKEIVRGVQDLLTSDDRKPLELLRTIKNESIGFIKRNSLPSPIREMEFVPRSRIVVINDFLEEQAKRYEAVVKQDVIPKLKEWKETYKKEFPDYYRPEKYPSDDQLLARFIFRWTFRNLDLPDKELLPDIYSKELKKAKEDVDLMKKLWISETAKELFARANVLAEQCKDGKVNASTVKSMDSWLEKFENVYNGFIPSDQMNKLVADVREYMNATDAEMLKFDSDFRNMVGDKMKSVAKEIKKSADVPKEIKRDLML